MIKLNYMNQKNLNKIKIFTSLFLVLFLPIQASIPDIVPFKNTFAASCVCGDSYCNISCEDSGNCSEDCGREREVAACVCGDGYCNAVCENRYNCPEDCGGGSACVCGDGYCNTSCENSYNCPEDCGPSCANECSYAGQKERRCDGPRYLQERTCGNYDSDSCLEWSEWQNEQNCGTSGWTDNYRCASSGYLEREYVNRGCSNNQCFSNSEWRQVQDCGTDSWTDNYRCSGNWVQREKIRRGCSNNACYQNSVWENIEDCSVQGKVCQNGQCILFSPFVDLKVSGSDGPITVPYNSAVNLSWNSSNVTSCYASGDWSGTKSISGSETVSSITSQKVFTIHCSGPGGSTSDSVTVYVSSLSFNVSLSASPSSGCVPLSNVSLTANVSRDFSGDLTYYFDCTSDGSWESIQTTSQNSLSVWSLCNYSSTGIYYAKVRVESAGTSREASRPINVSSCYTPYYPPPTVDIKVNGKDDYITVTSGTSVTLTWSSSNANSCQASGDWFGIKAISGSEIISNITSSKVFTITCTGPGGSAVDSVTVNVNLPVSGTFAINKTVRNLSKGTGYLESVNAEPNEVLIFAITIAAGQNPVYNLTVRDTLPTGILYGGDLKLNNITIAGDILAGINIGNLAAGETKTITFVANIAGPNSFSFGQTELTNTVSVSSETSSLLDTAKVIVSKKAVAGAATGIGTGLTNNVLLDSFILPLLLTLILVWLFRARIINFEKWIDEKNRGFQEYKAQKLLQMKVLQERNRELVKR